LRASEEEQLQAAAALIQELLSAEDMNKAIDEMLPYIDQTVIALLAMNITQAEEQGATAAATRLRQLHDAIMQRLQDAMPPQFLLLMQLIESDYPDETRSILKERKELVDDEFIAFVEAYIAQLESDGAVAGDQQRMLRHLRNILTLIRLGG
jgi:hypothetical protein